MLSSFSTINSIAKFKSSAPAAPVTPTITFTTGTVQTGTLNGFNTIKFANTGNYAFNISGFAGKTLYFIIYGGGSGGQHGFASSQRGGSGGSGGQCITGSIVIQSNNLDCTARVGLGGVGSYYGNGSRSTGGTVSIGSGGDDIGVLYGTTTTNDPENSVSAGQIKCSGGYTSLVSSEWGTIKALGGLAGDQTVYQTVNSCPATGYSLGTNTNATFYQGKSGGIGNFGTSAGANGQDGPLVYFANYPINVCSSAGGSGSDQYSQSTRGANAGRSSGSSGSYTGHSNPNSYDGFPANATFGSGGGSGSGSGGVPYNASNANYARQKGGDGGSGCVLLWYV